MSALFALCALPALAPSQLAPEWGPLLKAADGTWPENHCAIHWVHTKGGKMVSWGYGTNGGPTQTFVYDGFTGQFIDEPTPGQFVVPDANLFCAGHTLLSDGRAHVAGGEAGGAFGIKNSYTFNPATMTWTRIGDMLYERWYPTLTRLSDGRVASISGWSQGSAATLVPQVDLCTQAGTTWAAFLPTPTVQPHFYPFCFTFYNPSSPNAQSVAFVGKSTWPWTDQSYILTVSGSSSGWAPLTESSGLQGATAVFVVSQTEPLDRGTIYKFGGIWGNNPAYVVPWVRKLNLNNPTQWVPCADMTVPRTECNAVILPDGTIAIIGGTSAPVPHTHYSTRVPTAQIYNPTANTWGPLSEPMERSMMYHSIAALRPTTDVISAGGEYLDDVTNQQIRENNGQVLYPPYMLIDAKQPIIQTTNHSTKIPYNGTLRIKTSHAGDISKVTLISMAATTHAFDMNQRFINMTIESQGDGEVVVHNPKNSGVAPPGWYMLFIVSNEGVPSNARYMSVSN